MDLNFLIPRKFIGLYISSFAIEVSVVKKSLNKIQVEKIIRRKIATQNVDLSDQNEIICNTLKDMFTEHKLPHTGVILNLPTRDVIVRIFEMPRLLKEAWPQAIRFEGQKYVPFRIEEISIDYCVLNPDSDTESMRVLFVCAKILTITRYSALLARVGISCIQLSSVFLSMSKVALFEELVNPQVPTLIMIVKKKFYGRERIQCLADMILLYDGSPVVARDISVISSEENIDEKFFNEVFLSVKLFNSSLNGKDIEKVILFDGISLYKWDEFFEENFSASVHFANLSENLGVEPTDGVSLGAALSELYWPEKKINLFLDETSPNRMLSPFLIKTIIVYGAILLGIFLSFFALKYHFKGRVLRKEIKQMKVGLGELVNISSGELKKQKKQVTLLRSFLKPYQKKRIYLKETLESVSGVFSENKKIWLRRFLYAENGQSQKKIILTGQIFQEDSVQDILLLNEIIKKMNTLTKVKKLLPRLDIKETVQRESKIATTNYTFFKIEMDNFRKKRHR